MKSLWQGLLRKLGGGAEPSRSSSPSRAAPQESTQEKAEPARSVEPISGDKAPGAATGVSGFGAGSGSGLGSGAAQSDLEAGRPKRGEAFCLIEVAEYDAQQRAIAGPESIEDCKEAPEIIKEHFGDSLANLPAFPILAMEIFEAVRKPEANVAQVVALISRDPAVSAQIFKVANSAFSSSLETIKTLRDAVTRIGLRETANVAALALSGPLFDPEVASMQETFRPLWDRLWRHSIVTSSAAGQLSVEWHKGDPMRVFLAGILHDIGKTFVLRSLGALVLSGKLKALSQAAVEYLLESLHVDVGVYAARSWKLPNFIVSACARHHEPELPEGREMEDLHLLRVVSGIDEVRMNPFFHSSLSNELHHSIKCLGFEPKHLWPVAFAVREQAQKNPALKRASKSDSGR